VKFKFEMRDWIEYRDLPDLMEVDFHRANQNSRGLYHENMQSIWDDTLSAVKAAQAQGKKYVLLKHGWSTSHVGKTTSRSQIRKFMRSKEATPYIIRRDCIQHDSVFVAAIRTQVPTDSAI